MTPLEQLQKRVEELEKWKAERERQQITFPLDQESIDHLNKYFARIVDGAVLTFVGASAHYVPILLGKQGDSNFEVSNTYVRYTAEASTDVISIVDRNLYTRFADDEEVILYTDFLTGDTAPGGLSANTTYHVIDAATDGYSFKLSATQGGSAINITDAGVGKQFITKI